MKTSLDLFLELIKVSLGTKDCLSEQPTAAQWAEMANMAKSQSLVGVLMDGINRLDSVKIPTECRRLLMKWVGYARLAETRNYTLNKQTKEAIGYFRSKGFPCCVLKGQGIALLYDNPLHRNSGDIDVWVNRPREDVYRLSKEVLGKIEGANYHHIHYHLFEDTEVELHIWPSYLSSPFCNRNLQKFSKLYAPDDSFDYPSLAFNRVFIMLHCYRHICGRGLGMRQIMDYFYVLKQGFTEEERKDSLYWIDKLGMKKFSGAMMWFCKYVFGLEEKFLLCEPDEKEGMFMLDEVMMTGNMGHYDARVKVGAYSTPAKRFFYNMKRNYYMAKHCPHEALWNPAFSIWLYIWRMCKGLI